MKTLVALKTFIIVIQIGILTAIPAYLQADNKTNDNEKNIQAHPSTTSIAPPEVHNDMPERKDVPDFTLKTMGGDFFTLSEYEGEGVVLNIWAIPWHTHYLFKNESGKVEYIATGMVTKKKIRPIVENYRSKK